MTANVNCCHTQFARAEFQARVIAYSTPEMGCWLLHYQLDEPGHEQFQTMWTMLLYTTHGHWFPNLLTLCPQETADTFCLLKGALDGAKRDVQMHLCSISHHSTKRIINHVGIAERLHGGSSDLVSYVINVSAQCYTTAEEKEIQLYNLLLSSLPSNIGIYQASKYS